MGGSLLTEKNDKLAQTDPLRRYRDVRGIQKGQVTQAQPEIQNRGVTVAIEPSFGSAGTQGRGGAKDMVSPASSPHFISLYLCNTSLSAKTTWACLSAAT